MPTDEADKVDEEPGLPPVYGPFVRVTQKAWVRWSAVLVIQDAGSVSKVTVRPNSGGSGPAMLSEYKPVDLIDALIQAQGNDG